jgi:ribosomal protein S18 acetylase RimI-like enzyme
MTLKWRAMLAEDLPAVVALAEAVHPHHPESPAVFAERLGLAPAGCRVLARSDALFGYAVMHPWTGQAPPALDQLLGRLPTRPGAWHIHDVALAPEARGAGHAAAVVRAVIGRRGATLVALAEVVDYWSRLSFRERACADPAALASYGAGARFMANAVAWQGAGASPQ